MHTCCSQYEVELKRLSGYNLHIYTRISHNNNNNAKLKVKAYLPFSSDRGNYGLWWHILPSGVSALSCRHYRHNFSTTWQRSVSAERKGRGGVIVTGEKWTSDLQRPTPLTGIFKPTQHLYCTLAHIQWVYKKQTWHGLPVLDICECTVIISWLTSSCNMRTSTVIKTTSWEDICKHRTHPYTPWTLRHTLHPLFPRHHHCRLRWVCLACFSYSPNKRALQDRTCAIFQTNHSSEQKDSEPSCTA